MAGAFEKDGEVVAEVLASDAGIEPGYLDAYNARGDDTFEIQSWMIEGTTSRNLDTPPFGGQDGIVLHALYPIEGGVAAMVTDFNVEAASAPTIGVPGILALATPVAFARGTASDFRTMVTNDGREWTAEAQLGAFNAQFGDLAWAVDAEMWVLVIIGDEGAGVATSGDGSNWSPPDYTLDLVLPDGDPVDIKVIGEETFFVYLLADGSWSMYEIDGESGGDVSITEIRNSGFDNMFRLEPDTSRVDAIFLDDDLLLDHFILFIIRPSFRD